MTPAPEDRGWEILVAGWPPVPADELALQIRPLEICDRLLRELTGVKELVQGPRGEHEVPHDYLETRGSSRAGGAAGYNWTEQRSLETSALDIPCALSFYGIEGIELEWTFSWEHAGQWGHALFKHGRLRARFLDPAARDCFRRVWRAATGAEPVFEPERNR